MASAGIFSTTVLLLLLAVAVFTSDASDSVTADVEATDSAGTEETSNLLPVHHISGDKEETLHKLAKAGGPSGDGAENLASTEEHGKMVGSDWGKAKKMDDDHDDDDDKGDSDHDHDSDSDHDHDSDHDSDSDHDHDSDHDSDSDHDHDSDHDSDSDDSDHDSDSNSQDDDNYGGDSAYRRKKGHGPPGRKENPGSKNDDELSKVAIKV